jgi:ribonuclease HI
VIAWVNEVRKLPRGSLGNMLRSLRSLNMTMRMNEAPTWESAMHLFHEEKALSWQKWTDQERDPYSYVNKMFRSQSHIPSIQAYTDGSTPVGGGDCSGVGVLLLSQNTELEIAEPFKTSGNNFAAELMAILMAVRLTPTNVPLTVYTDSLSATQALGRDLGYQSERRWLRTAARPLVRSIYKTIAMRTAPTSLEWIRAHTGGRDEKAVGNDRADRLANEGRRKGEGQSLPEFTQNDSKVLFYVSPTVVSEETSDRQTTTYHIPGDVRLEAKRESQRQLLNVWLRKRRQGELVRTNPADTLELCRAVRRKQSAAWLDLYIQTLDSGYTSKKEQHQREGPDPERKMPVL